MTARTTAGSRRSSVQQATHFDGSTMLGIADNMVFSTGDVDFWAYAVVRPTNVAADGNQPLFFKQTSDPVISPTREYGLIIYDTPPRNFEFDVYQTNNNGAGSAVSAALVGNNGIYVVQLWHDKTADKVWIQVNGNAANSGNTTAAPADSAAGFTVGGNDFGADSGHKLTGDLGPLFWAKTIPSAAERAYMSQPRYYNEIVRDQPSLAATFLAAYNGELNASNGWTDLIGSSHLTLLRGTPTTVTAPWL